MELQLGFSYLNKKYDGCVVLIGDLDQFDPNIVTDEYSKYSLTWDDTTNTLQTPVNFEAELNKCSKYNIVVIPLAISYGETAHENILVYKRDIRQMARFEPNGCMPKTNYKIMDKVIKTTFSQYINTYLEPSMFCPNKSYQSIEGKCAEDIAGDEGYCTVWCLWFAELVMLNPDIEFKKLVTQSLKILTSIGGQALRHLIRGYSHMLATAARRYRKFGNIDKIYDEMSKSYQIMAHTYVEETNDVPQTYLNIFKSWAKKFW